MLCKSRPLSKFLSSSPSSVSSSFLLMCTFRGRGWWLGNFVPVTNMGSNPSSDSNPRNGTQLLIYTVLYLGHIHLSYSFRRASMAKDLQTLHNLMLSKLWGNQEYSLLSHQFNKGFFSPASPGVVRCPHDILHVTPALWDTGPCGLRPSNFLPVSQHNFNGIISRDWVLTPAPAVHGVDRIMASLLGVWNNPHEGTNRITSQQV